MKEKILVDRWHLIELMHCFGLYSNNNLTYLSVI